MLEGRRACDRFQTVQMSISFSGFQWEIITLTEILQGHFPLRGGGYLHLDYIISELSVDEADFLLTASHRATNIMNRGVVIG